MEARFAQRDFPAAWNAHQRAIASLSCAPPPDRTLLARFWLAHGAMAYVTDDRNLAVDAFAAAAHVDPAVWVRAYGSRLRKVYDGAAGGLSGRGVLAVDPDLPPAYSAWVDGEPLGLPVQLDAGLHLLQVAGAQGTVFHALPSVPEDDRVVVRLDLPGLPAAPPGLEAERTRKPAVWLAGAAVSGALSGAAAAGALAQNGAMRRATTPAEVRAAYGRQVGFAVTSYTLAGAAAAGLVVHFAR